MAEDVTVPPDTISPQAQAAAQQQQTTAQTLQQKADSSAAWLAANRPDLVSQPAGSAEAAAAINRAYLTNQLPVLPKYAPKPQGESGTEQDLTRVYIGGSKDVQGTPMDLTRSQYIAMFGRTPEQSEAQKYQAFNAPIDYGAMANLTLSQIASRYGDITAGRVQDYYQAHPSARFTAITQQYEARQQYSVGSGGMQYQPTAAGATNPFPEDSAAGIMWYAQRQGGQVTATTAATAEQEARAYGYSFGVPMEIPSQRLVGEKTVAGVSVVYGMETVPIRDLSYEATKFGGGGDVGLAYRQMAWAAVQERPGYTQPRELGDLTTQRAVAAYSAFYQTMGMTGVQLASPTTMTGQVLETQRQMAYMTPSRRDETFFMGELQKWGQNYVEVASAYHHYSKDVGDKTGMPAPANPFEYQADLAVEFLKGAPTRDVERFSPVSGEMSQHLPGGEGVKQFAWREAVSTYRRSEGMEYVTPKQVSFMEGVKYLGAAEGLYGPYGKLYGGVDNGGVQSRVLSFGSEGRTVESGMVAGAAQTPSVGEQTVVVSTVMRPSDFDLWAANLNIPVLSGAAVATSDFLFSGTGPAAMMAKSTVDVARPVVNPLLDVVSPLAERFNIHLGPIGTGDATFSRYMITTEVGPTIKSPAKSDVDIVTEKTIIPGYGEVTTTTTTVTTSGATTTPITMKYTPIIGGFEYGAARAGEALKSITPEMPKDFGKGTPWEYNVELARGAYEGLREHPLEAVMWAGIGGVMVAGGAAVASLGEATIAATAGTGLAPVAVGTHWFASTAAPVALTVLYGADVMQRSTQAHLYYGTPGAPAGLKLEADLSPKATYRFGEIFATETGPMIAGGALVAYGPGAVRGGATRVREAWEGWEPRRPVEVYRDVAEWATTRYEAARTGSRVERVIGGNGLEFTYREVPEPGIPQTTGTTRKWQGWGEEGTFSFGGVERKVPSSKQPDPFQGEEIYERVDIPQSVKDVFYDYTQMGGKRMAPETRTTLANMIERYGQEISDLSVIRQISEKRGVESKGGIYRGIGDRFGDVSVGSKIEVGGAHSFTADIDTAQLYSGTKEGTTRARIIEMSDPTGLKVLHQELNAELVVGSGIYEVVGIREIPPSADVLRMREFSEPTLVYTVEKVGGAPAVEVKLIGEARSAPSSFVNTSAPLPGEPVRLYHGDVVGGLGNAARAEKWYTPDIAEARYYSGISAKNRGGRPIIEFLDTTADIAKPYLDVKVAGDTRVHYVLPTDKFTPAGTYFGDVVVSGEISPRMPGVDQAEYIAYAREGLDPFRKVFGGTSTTAAKPMGTPESIVLSESDFAKFIYDYSGQGYLEVGRKLDTGQSLGFDITKTFEQYQTSNAPDIIYRGISGDYAENIGGMKPGDVFESKRLMSFSKSRTQAHMFTDTGWKGVDTPGVILKMKTTGEILVDVAGRSVRNEQELIGLPGQFRIVSIGKEYLGSEWGGGVGTELLGKSTFIEIERIPAATHGTGGISIEYPSLDAMFGNGPKLLETTKALTVRQKPWEFREARESMFRINTETGEITLAQKEAGIPTFGGQRTGTSAKIVYDIDRLNEPLAGQPPAWSTSTRQTVKAKTITTATLDPFTGEFTVYTQKTFELHPQAKEPVPGFQGEQGAYQMNIYDLPVRTESVLGKEMPAPDVNAIAKAVFGEQRTAGVVDVFAKRTVGTYGEVSRGFREGGKGTRTILEETKTREINKAFEELTSAETPVNLDIEGLAKGEARPAVVKAAEARKAAGVQFRNIAGQPVKVIDLAKVGKGAGKEPGVSGTGQVLAEPKISVQEKAGDVFRNVMKDITPLHEPKVTRTVEVGGKKIKYRARKATPESAATAMEAAQKAHAATVKKNVAAQTSASDKLAKVMRDVNPVRTVRVGDKTVRYIGQPQTEFTRKVAIGEAGRAHAKTVERNVGFVGKQIEDIVSGKTKPREKVGPVIDTTESRIFSEAMLDVYKKEGRAREERLAMMRFGGALPSERLGAVTKVSSATGEERTERQMVMPVPAVGSKEFERTLIGLDRTFEPGRDISKDILRDLIGGTSERERIRDLTDTRRYEDVIPVKDVIQDQRQITDEIVKPFEDVIPFEDTQWKKWKIPDEPRIPPMGVGFGGGAGGGPSWAWRTNKYNYRNPVVDLPYLASLSGRFGFVGMKNRSGRR